jgi:predicted dehydrogenase
MRAHPFPAMNIHTASLRIGIIGCDTSHATAFAGMLNDTASMHHMPGARIAAAFKTFSPDMEWSRTRVDGYIAELRERYGVEITGSIAELCSKVDAVIVGSVDGRPHLEQARAVIAAGKPVFVDKPLAATLHDAREIVRLAEEAGVPLWTGSAYRWYPSMRELLRADIGEIRGALSYGPAHLDVHHPDFYFYGIHPTEALYTVLGAGCETVSRTKAANTDVVVGKWSDGRIGTLIGLRTKALPHQVTVFGSTGFAQQQGGGDYAPLVAEIVRFFQTGQPPVSHAETVEMYAFMEAADESARRGGAPVPLAEV